MVLSHGSGIDHFENEHCTYNLWEIAFVFSYNNRFYYFNTLGYKIKKKTQNSAQK